MLFEPLIRPIILPLAGGLVCLLLPKRWEQVRAWLAILFAALTLLAVWPLFGGSNQTQLVAGEILLRVDALSGFVLLATAVLALFIAVYSLDYLKGKEGQPIYYACLLWSLAFSCGALLANDLLLLLICWGLLALTLYLMIGLTAPESSEAARKTFVIVGGSDALMLLGIAMLWVHEGTTRMDAGVAGLDSTSAYIAFFCLLAAVFAKVGAIPLHTWLPDCAEKAYAPVTAYLPAALDKLLGIYLLARMVTSLFEMTDGMNALLMFLGAVTIIGGALMALVQSNLKRLLAYCAIAQVGYVFLGFGVGTGLGIAAGLFHMLNHAIYKSCLFLGAGVVEEKTGTVDLDQLGGLSTRLPFTFAACLVASLAVAGIPPLNGFASKWMVYQAVIESGRESENMLWVVWLTAAMLGSALTLAIIVKLLHGVFLCKPAPRIRRSQIEYAAWPAALPMTLLAAVCVVFGVFAFSVPLDLFILPAVNEPVETLGTWWAGQASGLLLVAFILGWTVYAFTMRNGRLRKCPTFIGGERMDETWLPGEPAGPERHVEVTGVDFYRTVEKLPVLKPFYELAKRKVFDIYDAAGKAVAWPVAVLRGAHTGLLSLYLIWFVLGLLAVLYVMMQGVT